MKVFQNFALPVITRFRQQTFICRIVLVFLSFTCFHAKVHAILEKEPNKHQYAIQQQTIAEHLNPSSTIKHEFQKKQSSFRGIKTKLLTSVNRVDKAFKAQTTVIQVLLVILTIAFMVFLVYFALVFAFLVTILASGSLFAPISTISYIAFFVGLFFDFLLGRYIIKNILKPKPEEKK